MTRELQSEVWSKLFLDLFEQTGERPQLQDIWTYTAETGLKKPSDTAARLVLMFHGAGRSVSLQLCQISGLTLQAGGRKSAARGRMASDDPGQALQWKKLKRPIDLFLRSHGQGARLDEVSIEPHQFDSEVAGLDQGPRIVLRFSSGLLVIVSSQGDALSVQGEVESTGGSRLEKKKTVSATFLRITVPSRSRVANVSALDPEREPKVIQNLQPVHPRIRKLKRAIEQVEAEIQTKSSSRDQDCAEWIVAHQSLDVPAEMQDLISPQMKTVGQALEALFSRAKKNRAKLVRTQSRLNDLKRELESLSRGGEAGRSAQVKSESNTQKPSLLSQAEARGRTYVLSETCTLYIGRTGKENLALLRKASPTDLWIHIKDEPGAHGILRRPKGEKLGDRILIEAAKWVCLHSKGQRAQALQGLKFEVWVSECRYVRPIKGDHLGRVHHTNAQVLRFTFD